MTLRYSHFLQFVGTAAKFLCLLLFVQSSAAIAAEVKVWSGGVFSTVLTELGPQFERATGHKPSFEFGTSPAFARQIGDGQVFDVAILLPATIDDWIKNGNIVASSRTDIARAALGVAVRTGAPKPDIRSVEAFRQTLLDAKSVAHATEGATTVQLMRLLDRLEISAQMKEKLRPTAGSNVLRSVAQGDAEIVVVPIPEIVSTPGIDIVGPLPPELQSYINLTAGISSRAKEPTGAEAFIKFLKGPEGVGIINAKGLEPATQ